MFKAELELVNQAYTNNVVCVQIQWVVVIQLVDFVINIGRHVFVEVVSRANIDVFNNIYVAALYTETHNATRFTDSDGNDGFANKAVTTEVIAQYQFDFGLRPSIAYVQSKGKNIENIGDADLYKYYEVGATYYFNKNMSTYVDYKINRLKNDNPLGLATDNVVALGLVYQFYSSLISRQACNSGI